MEKKILLSARGLSKDFPVSGKRRLQALSRVDLDIYEGETLALVGESGCGKSTLGRTLIRLIPATEGSISFEGQDISSMSEKEFRPLRGKMQIIFQDPYASLNPRMTVRDIIAEPLETHHVCADARETTQRVRELMKAAGLSEEYLYRYPHQFSGGQRQRIGIARAIALKPKLIICDEPVSALDVSVQNQILNLLKDLQKEFGLTYLFISHDLSVVRFLSDRTCVMFLGKLCEVGNTAELYEKPLHPYTRFLLGAIPGIDPRARGEKRPLLKGELPSPIHPPSGCRFHTRCPYATERCRTEEPLLRDVGGRQVACHRCEEI